MLQLILMLTMEIDTTTIEIIGNFHANMEIILVTFWVIKKKFDLA